jgi:hypothetical protein
MSLLTYSELKPLLKNLDIFYKNNNFDLWDKTNKQIQKNRVILILPINYNRDSFKKAILKFNKKNSLYKLELNKNTWMPAVFFYSNNSDTNHRDTLEIILDQFYNENRDLFI